MRDGLSPKRQPWYYLSSEVSPEMASVRRLMRGPALSSREDKNGEGCPHGPPGTTRMMIAVTAYR